MRLKRTPARSRRGPLHRQAFGHTSKFKVISHDLDTYTKAAEIAYELNLQMTAHCIGDGALDVLFEAYKKLTPITRSKSAVVAIHGDFTDETVLKWMAEMES